MHASLKRRRFLLDAGGLSLCEPAFAQRLDYVDLRDMGETSHSPRNNAITSEAISQARPRAVNIVERAAKYLLNSDLAVDWDGGPALEGGGGRGTAAIEYPKGRHSTELPDCSHDATVNLLINPKLIDGWAPEKSISRTKGRVHFSTSGLNAAQPALRPLPDSVENTCP